MAPLVGSLAQIIKQWMTIKRNHFFVVEEIVPSVVEPSSVVSRIVYALLEHNFWMREGEEQRTVSVTSNILQIKLTSSTRHFVQVSFETHWEILSLSDWLFHIQGQPTDDLTICLQLCPSLAATCVSWKSSPVLSLMLSVQFFLYLSLCLAGRLY